MPALDCGARIPGRASSVQNLSKIDGIFLLVIVLGVIFAVPLVCKAPSQEKIYFNATEGFFRQTINMVPN